MIASSILNSITFKNVPTSNTYPNMWNTLHADRKQAGGLIKPYNQKFQKDHVVYLQFFSDQDDYIVLKSYNSITREEIETFTVKWDDSATSGSHYGTADNRYYTNFVVTLDSAYYEKQVYFKATQGVFILTSEPVFTTDLAYLLLSGILKYVKCTNLDRIESDLDDRFIDWSILQSTGKYLDFFVESVDAEPNDTDESEILDGSQSKTILSAVFFSGRTLKTGPIPDYMAARLGMASSLDVFTVNDLQYIKSGGIEQERFGGSTSYQISMKLTQKNAIGINVDNIGVSEGSTTPPISGTPMYIGSVTSAAPDETEVKLIDDITAVKEDHTVSFTGTAIRPCHAAPTAFGSLSSILDAVGDEIITGFAVTTLDFTIGENTVNFTIYTIKSPVTLSSYNITFKY